MASHYVITHCDKWLTRKIETLTLITWSGSKELGYDVLVCRHVLAQQRRFPYLRWTVTESKETPRFGIRVVPHRPNTLAKSFGEDGKEIPTLYVSHVDVFGPRWTTFAEWIYKIDEGAQRDRESREHSITYGEEAKHARLRLMGLEGRGEQS